MYFDVLLLVWDLVEGIVTACDRTFVGPLTRVNAQVVEQIMPLPEHFHASAVLFKAHEHGDPPARDLIEKFNLRKISRIWKVDPSFEIWQVTDPSIFESEGCPLAHLVLVNDLIDDLHLLLYWKPSLRLMHFRRLKRRL